MRSIGRILICAGIATLIFSIGQLRADSAPPVRVFASTELAEPLEKLAKGDKTEKLIIRPEAELTKWADTTDLGWAIVISADPKAPFYVNSQLKKQALINKGNKIYNIYLAMSAVSIPADNASQVSAHKYILSAKSLEIFRSYGFETLVQ